MYIMKLIRINPFEVGLLMKHGAYVRMLEPGVNLIWHGEVKLYDTTKMFMPPVDINILLQDKVFAEKLDVVSVEEGELVLHFVNNLLDRVLVAGMYTFWKSVVPNRFVKVDVSRIDVDDSIDRKWLNHRLLAPYVRAITVESHEKGLLFVDGKYVRMLDSGVYYWWKNAIPVHVGKADTRLQQMEINGQEILTSDKAALRINAWAQYRVTDPVKALLDNKDAEKQLYVALQLALRGHVAAFTFDGLLEHKDSIGPKVQEAVQVSAEKMGIEVKSFGIRDIVLPGDIRDIMNKVLVAEKTAQANVIMRREETAGMRSLLNTAKLMEDNAMLWKLKEMEYVEKIAEKISNISVNGNGALVEQLKQIFVSK
jgi:regulator of protease activity HflC (stomatin/prohibitin superfamily)